MHIHRKSESEWEEGEDDSWNEKAKQKNTKNKSKKIEK